MLTPQITHKDNKGANDESNCYKQPFLQGKDCNSDGFLREISYKVNLTELYQIKSTCFYNAQMEFCPILLKITNKALLKDYQCNYLLQVWNINGKMIYQRSLNNPISVWAISYSWFIFKPSEGDDDSDQYHVIDLKNDNATLLIKDPINDPSFKQLAYYDGMLYTANKAEILLMPCPIEKMKRGSTQKIELKESQIHKIVPGVPVHALINMKLQFGPFYWRTPVIAVFETQDNQLDFSQIIPENVGTSKFTYILRQQRDLVQRNVKFDAIQYFSYIIDKQNVLYGIAHRASGLYDIYWNMTPVDSPNSVADEVSVSFDCLYFLLEGNIVKKSRTSLGPQVNYQNATVESEEFVFENIYYQNIKNYVNLYNSYTLVKTTLYIVHNQFVSLYNIQENTWLKHCKFKEGYIERLYEKQCSAASDSQSEIAVILQNGSIYKNMSQVFLNANLEDNAGKLMIIDPVHRKYQIPGKIVRTSQDQLKNEWFYVMSKDDQGIVRLFTLHFGKLYEIDEGLVKNIDEFTNVVHLFSQAQKPYVILQKDTDVQVYELSLIKVFKDAIDSATQQQEIEEIVGLTCIFNQNIKDILGNIHSCISQDINDHIFFIDNSHFYKYSFKNKSMKVYRDQNCVGLYVVDEKYCYTLSHSSDKRQSGLRLYDINNILKKDTDLSYKLAHIQVGFSGFLDWNQDYFRLSLLKSLDTLIIVPALHRNTIAFIGMGPRENYLATKQVKDKFMALDDKNYIFTWSVITGKLLSVNKLPTRQDYSNFRVFSTPIDKQDTCPYNREWYQKILLVKRQAETNVDQHEVEDEGKLTQKVSKQTQFGETQKRQIREFRLIEIISDSEVREHVAFLHTYYENELQRIYFDTSSQYMIEKLSYPRIFLYEKEVNQVRRLTRWRFMKRIDKYPEELENASGFLTAMSPSFNQYIDIDRRENQFVIRDTFTLKVIQKIPKHIMHLHNQEPRHIMNGFQWIDDETIKIINIEGIEKLIDLKQDCLEIEYNQIPMFSSKEFKKPIMNYYNNRKPKDVSKVKDRLIRKYQKYKSAYYLDHKKEPLTLYEDIFTVDYQVEQCRGMHVADLSFTFLHWVIIEQLQFEQISIELIDNKQIELLFYNILPGGNTILHKLYANGEAIKRIMEVAHPDEENMSKIDIHVPLIQNLQGKSPLHICMDQHDIRTIDTLLTYLAGYGLDHHSRAIVDIIPFVIEKKLPSLLPYLDSRLCQTDKLSRINKGCLKDSKKPITEMSVWFGQEEYDKLMQQRIAGNDSLIERPIKIEFVDIPEVYHYDNQLCSDFFSQLADTDQYEIFTKKAIQKLIEFNYPLVKTWTIKKLQIPFMCYQVTLFVYLNFVFGQDQIIAQTLNFPMQILLGCFACYFLRNEVIQMIDDGWGYLTSVWNYIDIITPSTVLTVLFINTFNIPMDEETERMIQAIGVFFMWFKFLYFFRIFKSFGYLIRLMILVVADMKDFLVVLFFTLVAFGDTFLTISNGNKEGMDTQPFVFGFTDAIIYTYLIILGSFDMQHFTDSIATPLLITFFIMCTVFNTIVMLNLLIAIISETFSQFKENSESATYQEMAAMIAENGYLIPDNVKQRYAQKNKYLMVVTDLEVDITEDNDGILYKLDTIKKNVIQKMEKMDKQMAKLKKKKKHREHWYEKEVELKKKIMNLISVLPGQDLKANNNGGDTNYNSARPQHIHQPQIVIDKAAEEVKGSFKTLASQLKKLKQQKHTAM